MVTYTQEVGDDVGWKIMGCLDEQLDHSKDSIIYSLNPYYTLPQHNM